ncbi:hypothetical protein ACHWQZ_G016781 [Mnemiopsis leidyi]
MSKPIKRPTSGETEEDLLKLQAEFLKQKQDRMKKDVVDINTKMDQDSPATVNRKRKISKEPCSEDSDVYKTLDDHDTDLASILSNICELDVRSKTITTPTATKNGFPSVKDHKISSDSKLTSGGRKKSLFAMQFDKRNNFTPKQKVCTSVKSKCNIGTSSFLENVLPVERMAIEDETNKILNKMTEDEKQQEAERIFKNMDPKIVEFLRRRKREAQDKKEAEKRNRLAKMSGQSMPISASKTVQRVEAMDHTGSDCCHNDDYLNPSKQKVVIEGEEVEIPMYVSPGHRPNMGTLEPDKLQWMSDIPPTKPATSTKKESEGDQVRFDFDGKIVPRGTNIHMDRGLHHHGEEPSQAGYTLDELFILSRSMVLRQRQIAIETLVHITQRARHALYRPYVKQPMLQLLLDSGIVQLYRHALDTTEYELALQGLAALLLSPTEVFIQDELYPELNIFTLQPDKTITKDMDHDTVLATDVVSLLTDSQVMMKHGTLLEKIVELFLPTDLTHCLTCDSETCCTGHPSYTVVKILRILSGHSKTAAEDLTRKFSLETLIKMYLSLNHKDFKGDEVLKCQIEVARLWDVLLNWGLCTGVYTAVYPLLVRELAGGGQRSVKLTSSLVVALTTGLAVLPWGEVGSIYHPILNNILSWANSPPSGQDLPPKDDILLISTILKFLSNFVKLHHSKHYDVQLVDQVTDMVTRIIRPLVVGKMLDQAMDFVVYCKSFQPKHLLKVPSLPTLELHQYHKTSASSSDPLDLRVLSPAGEEILLFHACSDFIRQTCNFLSCAFNVNKQLSEVITGFLEKCDKVVLCDINRHFRYNKTGYLDTDVPDMILHGVTLLKLDYLTLAHKVSRKIESPQRRELMLAAGIKVVSELRAGFEYQQFGLISGVLFDSNVNKFSSSLGQLFIKNFENVVSRNRVMKSQKYWTKSDLGAQRSLYLGKLVEETKVSAAWVFLSDEVLSSLPEPIMVQYLEFLEYLITSKDVLAGVPLCVQLIFVMKVFLLPSQPFLDAKISGVLKNLLKYFSSIPYIDFRDSKLSGYPSFGDFFNTFCGSYEAEGFCDPVFAGYILLPTRCDYALTYRRLIWVERIETLRLLRKSCFLVSKCLTAIETDADMMTIYVTALKNGISGIPKMIAMHHLVRFLVDDRVKKEDDLLNLVLRYLKLCSEDVKEELLKFHKVNEFNEIVFHEKLPVGRREAFKL